MSRKTVTLPPACRDEGRPWAHQQSAARRRYSNAHQGNKLVPMVHADRPVRIGEDADRFPFGENWARFLSNLTEDQIAQSEQSFRNMLELDRLDGKSFLDVGSGSGLSSLTAMRLGADRVHSFDFDPESVACTRELKRRFFPDASRWTIEQGNVLDSQYLQELGQWDIVYSWGVLHH